MTPFILIEPDALSSAAQGAATVNSAVQTAAGAAGSTTTVAAAASDEVSRLAATFFNEFGIRYQGALRAFAAQHGSFVATLSTAGSTFAQAESAITTLLGRTSNAAHTLLGLIGAAGPQSHAAQAVDAILIMNGSGTPIPTPDYISSVLSRFLTSFTGPASGVFTPEGLYPYTGVKDLVLDTSLSRGLTMLNNSIINVLGGPGSTKSVSVLGYSQSAVLSSMEIPKLLAEGYNSSNASFTLIGNPSIPNGGVYSRFPTLSIPSLGITFGATTPSNAFPTTNWTLEYDGFADFPQYPINVLSDLNAVAGIILVHGNYPTLTPAELGTAIPLRQSGAPSLSQYYMIPTPNLPLLDPLRALPIVGNPLADLIQPDLRYLINWGYGDINYGWSTTPADIATPFGFLPPWETTGAILGPALIHGAQQGISAFAADIAAQIPTGPPTLPTLAVFTGGSPSSPPALPSLNGVISTLQNANTTVANGLVGDLSTAYATLLPTADLATALALTMPSYDVNLFLDGITQAVNGDPVGGLINAFGQPLAGDVGLLTLAGGFQLISVQNSLQTILTGVPNPNP